MIVNEKKIKMDIGIFHGTFRLRDGGRMQSLTNIFLYGFQGRIQDLAKYVYDVLGERYDSLEIGELRSSLSSTINANSEGIQALDNNTRRMFKEYNNTVGQLVDEATAWLTSGDGYVVATKDSSGNWKEILFMDTDDIDTAHNVLRINQNGIGFSSTGVAGPYTQAWTLDGKMVIGGTNAPSITVYDNSTPPNILFQINASGMIWNAANSSMDAQGNLTANGANLTNAVITGQLTSGTGTPLVIKDGKITLGDNTLKLTQNGGFELMDRHGSAAGIQTNGGGNIWFYNNGFGIPITNTYSVLEGFDFNESGSDYYYDVTSNLYYDGSDFYWNNITIKDTQYGISNVYRLQVLGNANGPTH